MSFEIKKTVFISFTSEGDKLAYELERKLTHTITYTFECRRYCFEGCNKYNGITFQNGREVIAEVFDKCDYIIFISACGIAVRMINGLIGTKDRDPGIVVMDAEGRFAISLLSGHLGGANELAQYLADISRAIPVITTATDVGKRFSPDLFAKKNHLYIADLNMAKKVAAQVLDGKRIHMISDYEMEVPKLYEDCLIKDNIIQKGFNTKSEKTCGEDMHRYKFESKLSNLRIGGSIASGACDMHGYKNELNTKSGNDFVEKSENESGMTIYIGISERQFNAVNRSYQKSRNYQENSSYQESRSYQGVLWLIPRDIVIGVGCKKNINEEKFEKEMLKHLKDNAIDIRRVREIHSVDIKRDEPAINAFAKKYHLAARFYSADELDKVQGDFCSSQFVAEITGVDNICERSAVMTGGQLIVKKCAGNGITFAAAKLDEWRLIFV